MFFGNRNTSMDNKLFCIRKNIIKSIYPNITNVQTPVISGAQDNILIANLDGADTVFKFSDVNLSKKNAAVCKLYAEYGIPVPAISAKYADGIYFEQYTKIAGKTLFEAINDGMPINQIKQIYHEILINFEKMSHISPTCISTHLKSKVHEIARINVSNANDKVLAKICILIVYLLNIGKKSNIGLYHSDITPKNVIISEDGHLQGFIDADNICICTKNHAFGMMAAKYEEMGFDINDLMTDYYKISSERLPVNNITSRVKVANIGKKLLWKHSQNKRK